MNVHVDTSTSLSHMTEMLRGRRQFQRLSMAGVAFAVGVKYGGMVRVRQTGRRSVLAVVIVVTYSAFLFLFVVHCLYVQGKKKKGGTDGPQRWEAMDDSDEQNGRYIW